MFWLVEKIDYLFLVEAVQQCGVIEIFHATPASSTDTTSPALPSG